ncbi:hypothetical protein E2C01_102306 [Portunus trituberculatus]|uniref:Uncharacterized protein n=1 Tax=Portunus trituberculatus TaxID=210409 RepID=A0A5B7K7U2_PORTR|nr:hypothetical protein [Portunus trituberculatus]
MLYLYVYVSFIVIGLLNSFLSTPFAFPHQLNLQCFFFIVIVHQLPDANLTHLTGERNIRPASISMLWPLILLLITVHSQEFKQLAIKPVFVALSLDTLSPASLPAAVPTFDTSTVMQIIDEVKADVNTKISNLRTQVVTHEQLDAKLHTFGSTVANVREHPSVNATTWPLVHHQASATTEQKRQNSSSSNIQDASRAKKPPITAVLASQSTRY